MPEEIDHKELGRKLKLFSFSRRVPGTVYWWPKGAILIDLIVNDLKKELTKQGYHDIKTAPIIDLDTLKASGHYDNYREKLFFTGNEKEMNRDKVNWCLKPMSCPGGIKIFNEEMHSYKDLPIKISEFGTVFRYEQPGEVNGLLRTRVITQDDAHIYCREDQIIKEELIKLIHFVKEHYQRFSFKDIRIELSTRPEKSIGTDEQWEKAENVLIQALEDVKIEYKENKGEGAFYGPKIDFHVKDAHGRSWQLGTIQVDFSTAERLDANYIDEKGEKQHPVLIHRAILGSVERFIGVLVEHLKGEFPVWLAPIQVVVASFTSEFQKNASEIVEKLNEATVRAEVDNRNESVNRKVRDAEIQKIPYIIVIGKKEVESGDLAVREKGKKDVINIKIEEFIKKVQEEIEACQ